MKRFLGLDIGGTKCAVVIGDATKESSPRTRSTDSTTRLNALNGFPICKRKHSFWLMYKILQGENYGFPYNRWQPRCENLYK